MLKKTLGIVAIGALLAAGFGGAQADDENIVVGFAVSTSGWQAAYTGPATLAAQVRIDEINAAGGLLGKQVSIAQADSKSDREEGVKAGQKVINDGADVVFVDCDFDMGAPAANAAQGAGLISLFLCAGDAKAGIEGIGPYSFTGGQAAHLDGASVATYAYDKREARTAYVLLDDTIEYNKSVCAGFEWSWAQKEGATIVGSDVFQNGDPSVQGQIDRIKSLDTPPDVIALCSYVPGAASALRQIRASGVDSLVVSGVAMDGHYWLEAVPNLSNFCAAAFSSIYGDAGDDVKAFFKKLEAKEGEPTATSLPIAGYVLMDLWAKAVEQAGTVDSAAVTAAMEKYTDQPTLMGPRSFTDQLHIQDKAEYAMICTDEGKTRMVDKVVAGPIPKSVILKN
jgi:branched-chain amino acid transport system substrate-binding protein